MGCGDSALFIFRDDGKLLYNNINISNEKDQFRRGSPFVAVLPDGFDEETGNVLFDFEEYPEDVQLLLCSDGLYDGFLNFEGLRAWLSERRLKLVDSTLRQGCLGELHHNLTQNGADDDISFIWLYPKKDRTSA
jgi:serine/threonine protein phosphatase PrpC